MKQNLFGKSPEELNASPITTNEKANNMLFQPTTNSTVINQGNVNMNTAQKAFDSARTYVKTVQTPSVALTEAQINALSPRNIFEQMLNSGRIGITRAANQTRKEGLPVVFRNKIQMDQLGRALAMVQFNIHTAWATQVDSEMHIITLMDNKGENDRAVIGRVNSIDKKVYYAAHYATKKFNDFGQLIGLVTGTVHPIGLNIQQRVDGYNSWCDAHNFAVKQLALGVATPEQKQMLGGISVGIDAPEAFVQKNTITHLNSDSIVSKYQLEAWILLELSKPAFEIFTRAKNGETFQVFMDGMVDQMAKAYKNELMKLAGLMTYQEQTE